MEASLTCAVCLNLFREPVTLPLCSHNFCKSCVLECAAPELRTVHVSPVSAAGASALLTVQCPLCRKVSYLAGGLSSLPVNTTLAEVVRLMGATKQDERGHEVEGRACSSEESGHKRNLAPCLEHPEQLLELYCKNCTAPCCGKCVSDRHQGLFHSINLLEMVYQEEKLTLFSSIKKLREVHEKLIKEASDDERDIEDAFKTHLSLLKSAFEEVQKALDLKKTQLLELTAQQQNTKLKEYRVWKQMQTHHKNTIECLLKDCESIVDEFEPKSFLKVACDLNKRMKSSLDIMGFTSDSNKTKFKWEPTKLDFKPALDAISALNISEGKPNDFFTKRQEDSDGNFSFKSITRLWKHGGNSCCDKYSHIEDEELMVIRGQVHKSGVRYISISVMPEFQALSYEELRLKCYNDSTKISSNNEVFSAPVKQTVVMCRDLDKLHLRTNRIHRLREFRLRRQDGFDESSSSFICANNAWRPDRENRHQQPDNGLPHAKESEGAKKENSLHGRLGGIISKASHPSNWMLPGITHGTGSTAERSISAAIPSTSEAIDNHSIERGFAIRSVPNNFVIGKAGAALSHRSNNKNKHQATFCKWLKSANVPPKAPAPFCSDVSFTFTGNPFFVSSGNASRENAGFSLTIPIGHSINTEVNEASCHLSANSTSSEEFFDANSNPDSDREDMNEEAIPDNSFQEDESVTPHRT
ncbi:hypothetical protein XENTR_v10000652 [Xenopus tropicalis]|uniref:Uncharacterized protein LOC100488610 n=1 Tax=Xenopus tropicalis TaxID=8364 RepID=A0A8J0QM42_XENTR|nr:uncharacterized protein LOC100488610 [Xenopus tropicalis]KAE8629980.1 hypothetical protein XENTR_v10000652 [Xenopus tropicalis]KAE8629981.1 hypothetical protein XENTR_v10000652 [Xenopus tropicalis]